MNKAKKLPTTDSQIIRFLGILIFGIGFVIYCNSIKNNYVLDDFSTIKDNRVTNQGFKAIPDIFSHFYRYGYYSADDGIYRPLTVTVFAIEWAISPNNPTLAHFVNVFLYALTGLIMFLALKKLFKNYNVILPFISTVLFIAHPIHTEVVANIKSLDEILGFLFSFTSLYFLCDYVDGKSLKKLITGVLFFFAALLSKESAITMLAGFPLFFIFFRSDIRKEIIISVIGMASVVTLFLIIRAAVLSRSAHSESIHELFNPLLLATDGMHRFTNEIRLLGYYLKLLIYPNPLIYDYSYNQIPLASKFDILSIFSLLIYVGLFIYAVYGFLKKELLSFGILFFMIAISIYSNIFLLLGVSIAERFVYFASFGFCFSIAVLLIRITKTKIEATSYPNLSSFFSSNKKLILIVFSISFLYSIRTISRNRDWKDNYTLFSHDIKFMPNNARAHSFLGNEIIKTIAPETSDKFEFIKANLEGISELEKSLNIYPNNPEALNCIGSGYTQIDSLNKAEFYFTKALTLNPDNPSYLASVYLAKGNYDGTVSLYDKILLKNPNNLDGLVYSGIAYGALKKYDESIKYLSKAITIEPSSAKIAFYLSSAYKFSGDSINAEKYFQQAYKLDPSLVKP
ncbi:MAG TPA: hypothetical protein VN698_04790 [Bacteroidia bacterium]|nr:hypothetical protein [Bacteroidia bacterium]